MNQLDHSIFNYSALTKKQKKKKIESKSGKKVKILAMR